MSIDETAASIRNIGADAWFDLTNAPTVADRFDAEATFTPTSGWWAHKWSARFGENRIDVTLTNHEDMFAVFTEHGAPSWVPRPPEGWNAGVLAALAAARESGAL